MKKVLIVILAVLMLMSFAACAPANTDTSETPKTASSPETEQTAPQTSATPSKDETLESLVAARNPNNMLAELTIYLELTTIKFEETIDSVKAAGLEDDEAYKTLFANWNDLIYGTVTSFLVDMSELGQTDEEISSDELFHTSMELYMSELSRAWTQMNKIADDPVQYLKQYDADVDMQRQETDGTWPTGYFFDDIVPPLDPYNAFYTDTVGEKTFNVEGGMECNFTLNTADRAAFDAYVQKLKDAGFIEMGLIDQDGDVMWMGSINSPSSSDANTAEYVFALVALSGSAAGTDDDPQLVLSLMNWDYIEKMGI